MIILEGPDGGGKSTLARTLAKKYRLMTCSTKGKPPKNPREYAYKALAVAASGQGAIRLYDRLFYSELVYGLTLRQQVAFTHSEQQYYFRMLQAMKTPIIFCLPPLEAVRKNIESSQQMKGVATHIDQLYEMYSIFAHQHRGDRPSSLIYDYTDGYIPPAILDWIEYYIAERKERTWR